MEQPRMERRQLIKLLPAFAALQALGPLLRALGGATSAANAASQGPQRKFQVALSVETLAGANVNDARAAYRVWADEVAKGLSLAHADIIPEVFVSSARIIQMMRANEIDCAALTAFEYAKVADLIDPDPMMVEDYAVDGIEYIILVHAAGPYQKVEDLRGEKIYLHHHRDTTLLEAWLSVMLAGKNLPVGDQFFGNVESRDNVNEVILPLFFRRVSAIAVTHRTFNAAVELNPQLGRDLKVIASSPKVVSDGFFFRQGSNPEERRRFQDAMFRFGSLPAGKQCLALYQSSGFFPRPCSVMNSALNLIHQYEHVSRAPHRSAG